MNVMEGDENDEQMPQNSSYSDPFHFTLFPFFIPIEVLVVMNVFLKSASVHKKSDVGFSDIFCNVI